MIVQALCWIIFNEYRIDAYWLWAKGQVYSLLSVHKSICFWINKWLFISNLLIKTFVKRAVSFKPIKEAKVSLNKWTDWQKLIFKRVCKFCSKESKASFQNHLLETLSNHNFLWGPENLSWVCMTGLNWMKINKASSLHNSLGIAKVWLEHTKILKFICVMSKLWRSSMCHCSNSNLSKSDNEICHLDWG